MTGFCTQSRKEKGSFGNKILARAKAVSLPLWDMGTGILVSPFYSVGVSCSGQDPEFLTADSS